METGHGGSNINYNVTALKQTGKLFWPLLKLFPLFVCFLRSTPCLCTFPAIIHWWFWMEGEVKLPTRKSEAWCPQISPLFMLNWDLNILKLVKKIPLPNTLPTKKSSRIYVHDRISIKFRYIFEISEKNLRQRFPNCDSRNNKDAELKPGGAV